MVDVPIMVCVSRVSRFPQRLGLTVRGLAVGGEGFRGSAVRQSVHGLSSCAGDSANTGHVRRARGRAKSAQNPFDTNFLRGGCGRFASVVDRGSKGVAWLFRFEDLMG